jgi:putative ABC transport system permease protein
MATLWQDLRYGARMLLKNPGFTLIAVATLSLGIGANTAIFSVANAILLRPLPYPHPERVVTVWGANPKLNLGLDKVPNSPGQFIDYRDQSDVFDHIAAFTNDNLNLEGKGEPEKLGTTLVTADFFAVLGVEPALGRTFLREEDQQGHNRVVILSHSLWRRRFGGATAIIGQAITLSGASYIVIGVMPPGFHYPHGTDLPAVLQYAAQTDVWAPVAFTPQQINLRYNWEYPVIARLRPGATLRQARTQLGNIAARNRRQYSQTDANFDVIIVPMQDQIVGDFKSALLILLGAAGFVLLIACANVASLLLARAVDRQKEIVIRISLGAGRLRIIRQLLTESALLSLIGGVLGFVLAFWGAKVIVALAPDNLPRIKEVSADLRVVSFTLIAALLTGMIFGLIPAWQASKPNLHDSLKEGARGVSRRRHYVREALVAAEVAMALALLIGAGLMIRSIIRLYQVDAGFDPNHVLTAQLSLPSGRYPKVEQRMAFYQQVVARLKALPGVASVAGTSAIPLSGMEINAGVLIEGRPQADSIDKLPISKTEAVTVDYFKTLGILLIRGRGFTEHDNKDAPAAVIINETFARRYLQGEDPIGKRLKVGADPDDHWQSIVGIVRDIKHRTLEEEPQPKVYTPYLQTSDWALGIVVRTTSDPRSLAAAVRQAIWAADQEVPIFRFATMDEFVSDSVSSRRFNLALLSIFAVIALSLAAIGIYGVTSYAGAQRTHEIGVRMALGAQRGSVMTLIIRQGMTVILIGISIGVIIAAALARLMRGLLYEVGAGDPLTYILVTVLLSAVALLACYFPARRATRVDPMIAIRHE